MIIPSVSTRPSPSRNHRSHPGLVSYSAAYLFAIGLRLWRFMLQTLDPRSVFDRNYLPSRPGDLKKLFSLTTGLILAWICILLWGERYVFATSLASCQWHLWEQWPQEAQPHHVVLLADPQLVDPHTYPGRPWPLSRITMSFSDLYLRRSHRYLQQYMRPDTLFFLGDLFDGGREWSTAHSESPEHRYNKYGDLYWMKEYTRFQSIFTDLWREGAGGFLSEPRGRKVVASLPGNHDLGFASGVQIPVKERFEAYFGPGNRIDIIGNHSFISVDTVSLSAMDQADPKTGSSGAGDGTSKIAANKDIWGPSAEFLTDLRRTKTRAAKNEYRHLTGLSEQTYRDSGLTGYAPNAIEIDKVQTTPHVEEAYPENVEKIFPSILLTHVPLYREPGTDCGNQRERGHAIAVQGGYQYQNVLTPVVSKEIVTRVGVEDLVQVYSGDDHDYCEIEHGEFTGRVKEITVKSMSLAMGVKKPGFLAVSLYNPINASQGVDNRLRHSAPRRNTIQNHLCLLPNELSILFRYASFLVLTLLALIVRAIVSPKTLNKNPTPLLPTNHDHGPPLGNGALFRHAVVSSSSSSSSVGQTISERSHQGSRMPRSNSPQLGGYGNLPPTSRSASPSKTKHHVQFPVLESKTNTIQDEHDAWGMPIKRQLLYSPQRKTVLAELGHSIARVGIPVLVFYAWLVTRG